MFPEAPASARPPGWWDPAAGRWLEDGYAAGSAAGPVAFAGLLWTALGDSPFRRAAERAADWLETLRGPRGFRGGTVGHEPRPAEVRWVSTEQNLDMAVLFARLGRREAAAHAEAAVRAAWIAAEGRFAMGFLPDGGPNGASGLDATLWPALVFPDVPRDRALAWALSRHGLPAGAPPGEVDGVDFDADRDGIWLEGTAQALLLARRAGQEGVAARFARTLERHRRPDGWIAATSVPWLTTGLETGVGSGGGPTSGILRGATSRPMPGRPWRRWTLPRSDRSGRYRLTLPPGAAGAVGGTDEGSVRKARRMASIVPEAAAAPGLPKRATKNTAIRRSPMQRMATWSSPRPPKTVWRSFETATRKPTEATAREASRMHSVWSGVSSQPVTTTLAAAGAAARVAAIARVQAKVRITGRRIVTSPVGGA